MKISDHLEEIAVYERRADFFKLDNPAINLIEDSVKAINTSERHVRLYSGMYFMCKDLVYSICVTYSSGQCIEYTKLCICTGATPSLLAQNHPNVIGIRDLEVHPCHFDLYSLTCCVSL